MFIEQHYCIAGLQLLEYQFALGSFLLFLRETLGVLEFRNRQELEGHVVADAINVVVDACLEMLVGGFTYENQNRFHNF